MDTGHNFSETQFPHLCNGYNAALSRESHGSGPRRPEVPCPMVVPPMKGPGTSVPESLLHHLAWLDFPSLHQLMLSLHQLGSQHKMPQTAGLNNRYLILTVLDTGSLRWRCQQIWYLMRAHFLPVDVKSKLCPHLSESREEASSLMTL